jgi:hypothetical protein
MNLAEAFNEKVESLCKINPGHPPITYKCLTHGAFRVLRPGVDGWPELQVVVTFPKENTLAEVRYAQTNQSWERQIRLADDNLDHLAEELLSPLRDLSFKPLES